MFFTIIFSINSIKTNYKYLTNISYEIEKEYNLSSTRYKKIITFILKNKLPQNITYFNLIGNVVYDLPPINELQAVTTTNDIHANKYIAKIANNIDITSITECYNNNCIKVAINKKEVLEKILKSKLWKYEKATLLPIKKMIILQASMLSFLEANKTLLFITLICFFILYSFQTLFLFRKNSVLMKNYTSLAITSDETKKELNKQLIRCNVLYDNILSVTELADEYFTHYIHKLLDRNIYVKKIPLLNLLQRIEVLFKYQLIKKNLKIIIGYKDIEPIVTDNEIVFITLLNSIYKAIQRSKMSTEIAIKIFQTPRITSIEIEDIGYEYNTKINDKIQIYELPASILEKLYKKAKIKNTEIRKDSTNLINIEISNYEFNETEEIEPVNRTIRIELTPL